MNNLIFNIRLFFAKKCGSYRYDGLICMAEYRGYPMARVLYKDGKKSAYMPIGNAVDYADMFGGTVVKV